MILFLLSYTFLVTTTATRYLLLIQRPPALTSKPATVRRLGQHHRDDGTQAPGPNYLEASFWPFSSVVVPLVLYKFRLRDDDRLKKKKMGSSTKSKI